MNKKDELYLKRNRAKALKRLENSASKYVLVRRFSTAGRAGLKLLIEEGLVRIIDAPFGRAYKLLEE